MTNLVFIGVPFWMGRKEHYSGSVEMVKTANIHSEFSAGWVDIHPAFADFDDPVNAVNQAVAEAVQSAIQANQIPLIIAGDCTTSLGNMKGLEQFSPDVLWYDAHGDFNTPETTPSGFLGGMPLAMMAGLGNQHLMSGIDFAPIDDAKIYLADGRDLDEGEAVLVAESKLTHWETLDSELAFDWNSRPLYVHFDGDIIHLDDNPAVSYPAVDGPSADDCMKSLKHTIASADIKAVHFTLWNANLDGADTSRETMLNIIRQVAESLHG